MRIADQRSESLVPLSQEQQLYVSDAWNRMWMMVLDADEIEARALELQASICQAMGDPKRLRILHALEASERSVGELATILGVSIANVSQHLGVLRGRGLVRSRREGSLVYYRLAYPEVMKACQVLKEILIRQISEGGELAGLSSSSDS